MSSYRRVVFFIWDGGLALSPSVVSAVRCLAAEGLESEVIFRVPPASFPPLPSLPASIELTMWRAMSDRITRFITSAVGAEKDNHERLLVQRIALRGWWKFNRFRKLLLRVYKIATGCCDGVHLYLLASRRMRRRRDIVIVATEQPDVVVGYLLSRSKRIQFFYWPMELYFYSTLKYWEQRVLKQLERWASKHTSNVLAHDERRAELFIEENRLNRATEAIVLPNSPLGPAVRDRTTVFHDRLGIDRNLRIICQIGGLNPGMCSVELAQVAKCLPNDARLVLHSSTARSVEDPYIQEIIGAANDQLALSLIPLSLNELPEAVSSVYVGLVFYRTDLGANFDHVSGASGKLAYYLRSCVPVICISVPGLVRVVEEFDCGICVSGPEEIPDALDRIAADYESYCENAKKCFESRFDFRVHFAQFIRLIESTRSHPHLGSEAVSAVNQEVHSN